MANILTNLRELSVSIPFKIDNINFKLTPSIFASLCEQSICNFNLKTTKISENNQSFSKLEMQTINNGLALGCVLKEKLKIDNLNNKVLWCGNAKDDLIDLKINDHLISLKEDSYILRNIGLYQLLNFITNSNNFNRGLHIFKQFAPSEFEEWFQSAIIALTDLKNFNYCSEKGSFSKGYIENNTLALDFNGRLSNVNNINKIKYNDFEHETSATTREKVFCKWLKKISPDNSYYKYKTQCAIIAGDNLLSFINKNIIKSSPSILNFFNLQEFDYIYAKNDGKHIQVFKVPSKTNINYEDYQISNIEVSIPASQLNLKTTISNTKNNTSCTLRNEIRYSHGQLNGTPEAKLYYDSGDGLEQLIYKEL